MKIIKEYHFYAAHRNQHLTDCRDQKCWNLHGHRYGLKVHFRVQRAVEDASGVSTLFGDFDSKVEPFLKDAFDHGLLMDKNDPLSSPLTKFKREDDSGEWHGLKIKWFDYATSVENIAFVLFDAITDMGFYIESLELKETDSSTLIYDRTDFLADKKVYGK